MHVLSSRLTGFKVWDEGGLSPQRLEEWLFPLGDRAPRDEVLLQARSSTASVAGGAVELTSSGPANVTEQGTPANVTEQGTPSATRPSVVDVSLRFGIVESGTANGVTVKKPKAGRATWVVKPDKISGRVYYKNARTGESAWEAPEGFICPKKVKLKQAFCRVRTPTSPPTMQKVKMTPVPTSASTDNNSKANVTGTQVSNYL